LDRADAVARPGIRIRAGIWQPAPIRCTLYAASNAWPRADLGKGSHLDLPDAFVRDGHFLAKLLERGRMLAQAPDLEDLPLSILNSAMATRSALACLVLSSCSATTTSASGD